MRTSSLSLLFLLFFSTTSARQVHRAHRHRKRFDLDDNGIPDLCTVDSNGLAYCLQADGNLAIFPAPVQKRFDLDGNGVPDLCSVGDDGTAHCLKADGTWTSFAAATYSATVSSTSPTTTAVITPSTDIAATTSAVAYTTTSIPSSTTSIPLPTGQLPDIATFKSDNGTKWAIEYVGNLGFTKTLEANRLGGDKCRSSTLGDKIIWNCGDMMCGSDYTICGFSMGPAFYGTESVMTVNTDGITHVNDNNFAEAWEGDPAPEYPQTSWGMDTTNIAAINDTTGIAFAWEIWRGAPDGSISDRGVAAIAVTLGETKPIASRVGPLITGPTAIQIGLLAILRAGDYIYTYSMGGPSNIIIGRVLANNDAFTATSHEFLSASDYSTWVTTEIPSQSSTEYGMKTDSASGQFGCATYGSVFYSNYFEKYVIICNIFESFVNMYVADNPWGPWSDQYSLLSGWFGYGSMAHPTFSPNGSHKEIYFSQGPDEAFNMFKITFDY